MNWKSFLKHTRQTKDGMFYCEYCKEWINKRRWVHYKSVHRAWRRVDQDNIVQRTLR